MTANTHPPSEWAAFLSLGVSVWASLAAAIWLTADAKATDFDPRPTLRRALQSPAADRVLVEIVNARLTLRDAAVWLAALLMLLAPSAPESAR